MLRWSRRPLCSVFPYTNNCAGKLQCFCGGAPRSGQSAVFCRPRSGRSAAAAPSPRDSHKRCNCTAQFVYKEKRYIIVPKTISTTLRKPHPTCCVVTPSASSSLQISSRPPNRPAVILPKSPKRPRTPNQRPRIAPSRLLWTDFGSFGRFTSQEHLSEAPNWCTKELCQAVC